MIIGDDCSKRDANNGVGPSLAVLLTRSTSPARFGSESLLPPKMQQRREIPIPSYDDISTAAAIATIRPAAGNELLVAKTGQAITTITSFDVDAGFINEPAL